MQRQPVQLASRRIAVCRRFALTFYACGIVVCLLGFWHFDSNMEDVMQWLPDETADRELYEQFTAQFGVDDFLVVTWPGCTVADPRCDTFVEAITAHDQEQFVQDALSGRHLIDQLARAQRAEPDEIMDRFRGTYFGADDDKTCVVVTLTRHGMQDRRSTIHYVKQIAYDSIEIAETDLVLAGYPQMGAIGDAFVKQSIRDSFGLSCVISTLVALICLRSFRLTIVVLATGGLAAGLSIAIVTLSGAKWGGLSSVIPTLAYILSISGGLHLVNYAKTPGNDPIMYRVLRIGWKPCVLSAVTTIAGMLSLCRSEFSAIREFGLYCAGGILASLVCQLALIPVAVDWLRPTTLTPKDHLARSRFLDLLLPRSRLVTALFILATVLCGFGLTYLQSNLEVERNFALDSPVMRDIAWFEDTIGPVDQTELLITFHSVTEEGITRRLRAIRAVESALQQSPAVHGVLSLSAWLPPEPQGAGARQTIARTMLRKQLQKARDDLSDTSYLSSDGGQETWRVSVRFPFLASTDFQALEQTVPQLASTAIAQQLPSAEVTIQHTGVSLLYHIAQQQLIADLYRNFATAFLLILPLMILALRSVTQGLVAMIPNVCPAAVAYGALGWLDIPLDIGMAIAACVALGIAVDDTIHFMLRFREAGTAARHQRSGRADHRLSPVLSIHDVHHPDRRTGPDRFPVWRPGDHDAVRPAADRNARAGSVLRPAVAAITDQVVSPGCRSPHQERLRTCFEIRGTSPSGCHWLRQCRCCRVPNTTIASATRISKHVLRLDAGLFQLHTDRIAGGQNGCYLPWENVQSVVSSRVGTDQLTWKSIKLKSIKLTIPGGGRFHAAHIPLGRSSRCDYGRLERHRTRAGYRTGSGRHETDPHRAPRRSAGCAGRSAIQLLLCAR